MWRRRGEIVFQIHFPIITKICNSLNEHGGVTNRFQFVSLRGEACFPPYIKVKIFIKYFYFNAANIWGILVGK